MDSVAKLLDTAHGQQQYGASLARQQARVADPELTPSARVLREMREQDVPFFRLAMNYSLQWAEYFQQRPFPTEAAAALEQESRRSLEAQRDIEASDDISFEQYLENFFSQYQSLQG
jgi:glutamate--cysteine ligase